MVKETNLSEGKIQLKDIANEKYYYRSTDVKEFVKKLKDEFWCEYEKKKIDKIFGKKLT